jgi:hypothetical protein
VSSTPNHSACAMVGIFVSVSFDLPAEIPAKVSVDKKFALRVLRGLAVRLREHFDARGEGDRMRLRVLLLLVSGFGCMLWSCAQQSVEPIKPPDWPTNSSIQQVLKTPQQCGVNRCGAPTPTFCSVSCYADQVATCSCDCTSRLLGVCTELKSSCSCEDPTKLRWWPERFPTLVSLIWSGN